MCRNPWTVEEEFKVFRYLSIHGYKRGYVDELAKLLNRTNASVVYFIRNNVRSGDNG